MYQLAQLNLPQVFRLFTPEWIFSALLPEIQLPSDIFLRSGDPTRHAIFPYFSRILLPTPNPQTRSTMISADFRVSCDPVPSSGSVRNSIVKIKMEYLLQFSSVRLEITTPRKLLRRPFWRCYERRLTIKTPNFTNVSLRLFGISTFCPLQFAIID
jgi:hypothetical protein